MTCLVFRDGVLAADVRSLDIWTPAGDCPKIGKRGKLLYGAAGETAFVQVFIDWVSGPDFITWLESDGKDPYPMLAKPEKDRDTNGFVILPDNSILRFESGCPPYRMTAPFFAFGTGNWIALGAMEAGADAVKALQAAQKWDVGTGDVFMVLTRDSEDTTGNGAMDLLRSGLPDLAVKLHVPPPTEAAACLEKADA